jgi:hypothetical protein
MIATSSPAAVAKLFEMASQMRVRADEAEAEDASGRKGQIMAWRHAADTLEARANYMLVKANESLT